MTYHHNLFTRVDGRNPSIRFGTGHVYNNHYLNIPDYGIASRQNAQVRVENNYFDNVDQPIRADTSLSDVAGFVNQVNTNIFVNCGPNSITTPAGNFVPPYSFPWIRRQRARHRAAGRGSGEGHVLVRPPQLEPGGGAASAGHQKGWGSRPQTTV